jgi:hypothetical protein
MPIHRWLSGLLLLAYMLLGVGYALRTAPWQSPDEPAHYNVIAQIVAAGCCPVIEAGDWDSAYLSRLTTSRFHPDDLSGLAAIQYEDHQPPLYYLLAAPLFQLTDGSLTALRLLSVVIGAGVVLCAYGIGRALLPDRPLVALGAAGLVAFLPQHMAMLASVNNDALTELLIGLALLLLIHTVRATRPPLELILSGVALVAVAGLVYHALLLPLSGYYVLLFVVILALTMLALNGVYTGQTERALLTTLGTLLGLIFLTKTTGYFLALPLLLAVSLRGRVSGRRVRSVALLLIPALILGGLGWGRNLLTYGVPDFLGLARHDAVVVGQLRTAELVAQVGAGEYARQLVTTTFNSFIGQFGWMALPPPAWMSTGLLVLFGLGIVGSIAAAVQRRGASPAPGLRAAWGLLLLCGGLALAQFAYYNTTFVQFQGRYLFPALIPFGVAVALGWDTLARRLPGGERPLTRFVVLLPALLLIPLNLFLLWRVIPGLAP